MWVHRWRTAGFPCWDIPSFASQHHCGCISEFLLGLELLVATLPGRNFSTSCSGKRPPGHHDMQSFALSLMMHPSASVFLLANRELP